MKDNDRLMSILSYIQVNYRAKLDLKTLSEQFYLSPSYLSKYIGENLGMGFSEYLNNVRLGHAMEALKMTDHSITQIACDAGFPNLVTFNRTFRRKYGTVPSIYRKKINHCLQELSEAKDVKEYKITANVSDKRRFEKNWLKVMNLGAAEDLQMEYIREHVLLLKRELDFKYGRIDSLFCPENLLDFSCEARYNFSVLDDILDFMIKNKISPFLNLGLKRKKIVRPDMGWILWRERISKTGHLGNYIHMLSCFIRHCAERYGESEVLKWRFELWWERGPEDNFITEEQMALLKIEYDCIKRELPGAFVGGLGFNIFDDNASIGSFLERYAGKSMALDFISVSIYPYNLKAGIGENKIVPDECFMEKELAALQCLLTKYGYGTENLWITEWNLSVSSRTWLNDVCYKGAYLVRNLIASVGYTPCMAYWMSTDRTEEYFDSVGCLYGGWGVISRNGIYKSAFYALRFMENLGTDLLAKGENYIVTSTKNKSFYIVCHYMKSPSPECYIQDDEGNHPENMAVYFSEGELRFHIRLLGLAEGNYCLRKHCISPLYGSVFEEWGRRGFRKSQTREETEYLKSVSVPYIDIEMISAAKGALSFDIKLQANEIQFIGIVQEESVSEH